jgi:methylglutaconyl-CoA hydratase
MSLSSTELSFINVGDSKYKIAVLALAKSETANAFNAEMMKEITECLSNVEKSENVRALVLYGKGKHFSAGADLGWMKQSATLTYEQNIDDSHNLTNMFEKLFNLKIPTVALVKGAAFGGAVGLAACCDVVLCEKNAKICLSEVRLGLLPAVIMPYLAKRILPGQLKRLSLGAQLFRGTDALIYGLADRIFEGDEANAVLIEELNHLLVGGPYAQELLKKLHRELHDNSYKQCNETAVAIATARTSKQGQSGLSAFFDKANSPWITSLDKDQKIIG